MGLFDFLKANKASKGTPKGASRGRRCPVETVDNIKITYRKHPFSKCIKIIPKCGSNVLVTMPRGVSYSFAKDFVMKNLEWIKKVTSKSKVLSEDEIKKRRALARKILPKRLDELAKEFGFKYSKVFIKNQGTIWGSCSYKNNINLNLNLVMLDSELIDYVLLHELTHTVHKNHQKAFYDLLLKNMPNALSAQKRLKKVKIGNNVSAIQ